MARSLVISFMAGCSFSLTPGTGDAPPGGDGAIDARDVDAAPLGAWSAPQRFTELSTSQNEDDPSLTADLLEIYFGSDRTGTSGAEDIWFASRTSVTDPFGPPTNLTTINSSGTDSNVRVSADGLAMFFASDRSPSQNFDLWTSTRATRSSPWSAPTRIMELASVTGDFSPHPSADLLRLTFCSMRGPGDDENIFVASRPVVTAVWGAAMEVSELSTSSDDCDPMDPDRNTIYFSSDRPGTLGGYDLYVATRPTGGTYATPTHLTSLSSDSNDRDVWVSADQRLLVFASGRNGGDDIYYSTR